MQSGGIEAIFKEWSVLHFESCRIACAKSLRQHRAVPVQWGGEEIGGTGEKGWGLPCLIGDIKRGSISQHSPRPLVGKGSHRAAILF